MPRCLLFGTGSEINHVIPGKEFLGTDSNCDNEHAVQMGFESQQQQIIIQGLANSQPCAILLHDAHLHFNNNNINFF